MTYFVFYLFTSRHIQFSIFRSENESKSVCSDASFFTQNDVKTTVIMFIFLIVQIITKAPSNIRNIRFHYRNMLDIITQFFNFQFQLFHNFKISECTNLTTLESIVKLVINNKTVRPADFIVSLFKLI